MNFRRLTTGFLLLGFLFTPFLAAQTTATSELPYQATHQPPAGEQIVWPPNQGFFGNPQTLTLPVGTKVDRYGYPGGTFVAPEGTPFGQRALPEASKSKPYFVYEVMKPITCQGGIIAPWFGEPGLGTQFDLPKTVQELLDDGSLKDITPQKTGK